MEYLDMGLGPLEYLGDRSHCEIAQPVCYGHYAKEGYAAIADIVANYLSKQKTMQDIADVKLQMACTLVNLKRGEEAWTLGLAADACDVLF